MKKFLFAIVVVGLLTGGYYYFSRYMPTGGAPGPANAVNNQPSSEETKVDPTGGVKEADVAEIPKYQYTKTFTNPTYHYAFKYPEGFSVNSNPADEGEVTLVMNPKTNVGVQILVTQYDGSETVLTEGMIHESIPDMAIREPQELLLGGGKTGKGLAFVSDNEAFGGESREVWFIYKGNLYQISTYRNLDEFLKGLFATWQFGK